MKINKSKYEGYLWYSDNNEPDDYHNEDFPELIIDDNENPFIMEGQLFDCVNQVSIRIKYIDGKYDFKEIKLTELENMTFEEYAYCAHRMGDVKLKFRQYWKEEPDALCEGMPVLQPAELVFVGFYKKEK